MKLIIDIDENIFTRLFDCVDDGELSLSYDELDRLETSVRNGIPYEERPQGEWNEIQAGMFACPFCGARPHKDFKNFCAKCGADMRKGGAE